MRGADSYNESLFTTVRLEDFVPARHPLRPIRTWVNGAAERSTAARMLADVAGPGKRVTVGADKAYDTKGFVKACREINVTTHVAQKLNRIGGSAIDGRTVRHAGYERSQRMRKRIEQCFGWGKLIGPIRQVMVKGLDKVDQVLTLTMAAYNLTRMRTLAKLRPQHAQ